MATTTKSKAKSKTAKKTVTKAAKTTKKTVAAKAVKATPTKKTFAKKLNRLNLISGILSLALAGAAGFLMNNTSYQLFTGLVTKDELASKATTVFVPAIHAVCDVELRWGVVAILLLSAIVPLLAATRNRKQYEASLAKKVMPWRWICTAVVGALMVELIALVSGVQDISTLKLIAGLIVVTSLLGWLSEKQNAGAAKPAWDAYILSLVTGTLPWLVIAAYAVGTTVWGMVRYPWFVYGLYAATLIAFMAYALNGKRYLKALQSYEAAERNSLRIGIFAKAAFAVILIVGLYK